MINKYYKINQLIAIQDLIIYNKRLEETIKLYDQQKNYKKKIVIINFINVRLIIFKHEKIYLINFKIKR